MTLKTPRNQHQLCLWYLIELNEFSLMYVIRDSMFFKFQTRLSELEKEYGALATRKKIPYTNKHGNSADYNLYKAIDKNKLKRIYNKI